MVLTSCVTYGIIKYQYVKKKLKKDLLGNHTNTLKFILKKIIL